LCGGLIVPVVKTWLSVTTTKLSSWSYNRNSERKMSF